MTAFSSVALSALVKTAVRFSASCNPKSADVSITSFNSDALSAFFKVFAKIDALPWSSFLEPVPSSVPKVSFATSITAFNSTALSAFENTGVKFSASCAPKSPATSITSFSSVALSAFCKVLVKIDAFDESSFLAPVPSSVPKVSLATSMTSFKSSALSAFFKTDPKFSLSWAPRSAAT